MSKYFVLERSGILKLDVFESLAKRVRKEIMNSRPTPRLPEITCAASLAHHGLLGSVDWIRLGNVDLRDVDPTSVPAEHLTSLVSCVTGWVSIMKVSGCDLVTILDNVKSRVFRIIRQSLDSEETQAMVRAMESRVEMVKLNYEVKLDIRILMEHNGLGKCREGERYIDTADKYKKQLRTWATSRNWAVIREACMSCSPCGTSVVVLCRNLCQISIFKGQ